VKEFFHREGIHSTTIQLEYAYLPSNPNSPKLSPGCQVECPKKMEENGENEFAADCVESSCCRQRQGHDNKAAGEEKDFDVVTQN